MYGRRRAGREAAARKEMAGRDAVLRAEIYVRFAVRARRRRAGGGWGRDHESPARGAVCGSLGSASVPRPLQTRSPFPRLHILRESQHSRAATFWATHVTPHTHQPHTEPRTGVEHSRRREGSGAKGRLGESKRRDLGCTTVVVRRPRAREGPQMETSGPLPTVPPCLLFSPPHPRCLAL